MTQVWVWTRIALTAIALVWWAAQIVHVLEWQDRHADRARARQHKMTPWAWVTTNAITKLGRWPILLAGLIGAAVIVAFTAAIPLALTAVPIALAAAGYRNLAGDPNEIIQLRQALAGAVGVDARGRPPKVTYSGTHPSGGPLRVTIYPTAGWKHWNDNTRKELERAIEATLPGDWEVIEWSANGVNVWERLPELPTLVPYPGPIDGLDWHQIPVGVDGYGQPAILDLAQHPHALIAGTTGAGKTSFLRVAATHLLHHEVLVAALDINYAGLAFLEGRPGVAAAFGFQPIADALHQLRLEVEDRLAQLKRDRSYRQPLVILIDEVEALFDEARRVQVKDKGSREPPVVIDVHQILRMARKVNIHVVLATQRPDADFIPGAMRDLAGGRVAVGKMGQKGAEMMLDEQAERAKSTPAIVGRAVLRCGTWIGWLQGYWLADPDETKHAKADRDVAESMLPPRPAQQLPSSTPAVGQVVTNVETGLDTQTEQGDLFARALGRPGGVAGDAGTVTGDGAETLEERKRRRSRERQARHRARKREELAADPDDPRHGTLSARVLGCKCARCEPVLVDQEA